MSLKVRVRFCGDSLAITLPAQVAKMHDIKKGDTMEISPIGSGEFKIKKIMALVKDAY
jgi:antitoxin component of MazEF toxin-antitoxin module